MYVNLGIDAKFDDIVVDICLVSFYCCFYYCPHPSKTVTHKANQIALNNSEVRHMLAEVESSITTWKRFTYMLTLSFYICGQVDESEKDWVERAEWMRFARRQKGATNHPIDDGEDKNTDKKKEMEKRLFISIFFLNWCRSSKHFSCIGKWDGESRWLDYMLSEYKRN